MNNNDNDIFELLIALLAIGCTIPLAGVGIYATILSLL
jgi:hypothetical protein